jgi:hypothetical protein
MGLEAASGIPRMSQSPRSAQLMVSGEKHSRSVAGSFWQSGLSKRSNEQLGVVLAKG